MKTSACRIHCATAFIPTSSCHLNNFDDKLLLKQFNFNPAGRQVQVILTN
ncbi:hypothetical protein [Dyadobacter luticola]|nr:hypothetical protein [Dyadobacter luticola]